MNTLFDRTLRELEDTLTCRLLGSELVYPETVRLASDPDEAIVRVARRFRFSRVPLKAEPDGPITQLAQVDWRGGRVAARAPIALANVVASDTPIARVSALLLERGFLLLLNDDAITQILTPSDLNKLPMSLYVFTLVSHLEGLIADAIDRHFPDDAWTDSLFPDKRREIENRYEAMQRQDFETRRVDVTTFSSKLIVVEVNPGLLAKVADLPRDDFRRLRKEMVFFRNQIAHGNPLLSDLADDPRYEDERADGHRRRGIRCLNEVLTAMADWIERLSRDPHHAGGWVPR